MKQILTTILLLTTCSSFAQTTNFSIASGYSVHTSYKAALTPIPPPRNSNCTNGYTVTANVLAVVGGALIGWPLGTAIGGGDPEWVLAGIGAGVIAVAIPLAIIGKKQCSGYATTHQPGETFYTQKKENTKQLYFAASGNTIGLSLSL